jgi:hypothetical protein
LPDRSTRFLIDTNVLVDAIKRERMRSTEEIRKRGIEALAEALGPVDAVRFLQSFDLGKGEYTKERDQVLDLELDEIVLGIKKRKKLDVTIEILMKAEDKTEIRRDSKASQSCSSKKVWRWAPELAPGGPRNAPTKSERLGHNGVCRLKKKSQHYLHYSSYLSLDSSHSASCS